MLLCRAKQPLRTNTVYGTGFVNDVVSYDINAWERV